ncbi:hypothetical protein M011DRAFT_464482 [Sporormia fimetaria CBS 119925]|uniref:CoA-dependent acyltransferase n=1 Tax=Sporormia fimetaria CBS 119925 TaxID=1340428 RepID=A0A6A6VKK9_9PLEO|nr:hypothetical protein M011DRAFT_464482 [Sporormia fimetaria CBS 119925]
MSTAGRESVNWLSRWANNYHAWKQDTENGKTVFRRPLGLVESSFDADGTDCGGRADMNGLYTLEIRHTLSKIELREFISLAWTAVCLQHVLLQSKVVDSEDGKRRAFVIEVPDSYEEVVQRTADSIVWLDDYYNQVDDEDLYKHAINVSRIVKPDSCLSRLHVLPLVPLPNGNFKLQFLLIMAHQISDGLSSANWISHFLRLLNTDIRTLRAEISTHLHPKQIQSRLPPAQEDLYPRITGSKARQRWFWALIRVLRHLNKPLPPTFANPLFREKRLTSPIPLPPTYASVFDYTPSTRPPLNSGHITVALSPRASARLISLCRTANISIGAGCFALSGLAMMELYERRYPDIPASRRPAFCASFPLNPRAFFGRPTGAESCMLAFSEGIVMPFLPSDLSLEGRFKLVGKHANRELKMYQKRQRTDEAEAALLPHSSRRLLANGYIAWTERMESRWRADMKTGADPQGELRTAANSYGAKATCGVSSMGSMAGLFREGKYDFEDVGRGVKRFVADYRSTRIGVRARDDEFLVGSSSDAKGIVGFGVSYDLSAIDEEAAGAWAERVGELLEEGERSRL